MTVIHPGDRGIDCGAPHPNYQEIARLGYRFVCRYLKPFATHPYACRPGEITAIHAAGMGVLLVWETSTTRPFAGAAAGTADGFRAKQEAALLNYPPDQIIMAAVDTDVTASTVTPVRAYMLAFRDAVRPHPCGVYGDTDTITVIAAWSALNWLPNARAWSQAASPAQQLVHVRQHGSGPVAGGNVDTNTCTRTFSAWGPEPDQPSGDDMPALAHNLETRPDGSPPRGNIFALMPEGTLRHIGGEEWLILGQQFGVGLTNAQIGNLGFYDGVRANNLDEVVIPPIVIPPIVVPTTFTVTGTAVAQ